MEELREYASNASNLLSGTLNIARIADGAITSAKIADGTIVEADLSDAIKNCTTQATTIITTSSSSEASNYITAGSNVTISHLKLVKYGIVIFGHLNFSYSSAITANQQINVGTLKNIGTIPVRGVGSSNYGTIIVAVDGRIDSRTPALNAGVVQYANFVVMAN